MGTRHPDDESSAPTSVRSVRLQEIFVPVHGFVRLFPEEVAVINHPAFQRLRRCRQLGFAHLLFPGATHTRFEHSIGACHVAEKMCQFANANFHTHKAGTTADRKFPLCEIQEPLDRIIRLGALLHDIGHVPLGHSLEDELHHLTKHEGAERIRAVADRSYPEHKIDRALGFEFEDPKTGWSLRNLVDQLYEAYTVECTKGISQHVSAFDIVELIIGRPPKEETSESFQIWAARNKALSSVFPLTVCRDLIGNTICADFIDYLYRDWYHIGKPIQEDRRLYQYLEVRVRAEDHGKPDAQKLIINMGPDHKFRHDAITNIVELLGARYKLAETVLFHRTKLAITALLDRCFMELRHLYQEVGLASKNKTSEEYLSDCALDLLIDSSDDDIPNVIVQLAEGVTVADRKRLIDANTQFERATEVQTKADNAQPNLLAFPMARPASEKRLLHVARQQQLIRQLAEKLRDRTVYTLATRVAIREIEDHGRPSPRNPEIPEHLRALTSPEKRRQHLLMLEALFGFPEGSTLIYVPPQTAMNAKLADVPLLIGNQINSFSEYEEKGGTLTGMALQAQISRFYQLWGVSIYVDRPIWHSLKTDEQKEMVSHAFRDTIYINRADERVMGEVSGRVRRAIDGARAAVAFRKRAEGQLSESDEFAGDVFVSGLPFSLGQGG